MAHLVGWGWDPGDHILLRTIRKIVCKGTPVEKGAMLGYFAGAHRSKGSRLRRRGLLDFIRARSWTSWTNTPPKDP